MFLCCPNAILVLGEGYERKHIDATMASACRQRRCFAMMG